MMSKHGARVWLGSMVRVKGIHRACRTMRGEVPLLGARYVVDARSDVISFHFKGCSGFGYKHSFSGYCEYEEKNDFVMRGKGYDYVYTKLPATTDATLFFSVFRVPHTNRLLVEPSYATTGKGGLVLVKSIRASGFSSEGVRQFVRWEFEVERLAMDRALEQRRSLGARGNIISTISYMRSLRVQFRLNGVAIGLEHSLSSEILESAAVAVEVIAVDMRKSAELDEKTLTEAYEARHRTSGILSTAMRGLAESCITDNSLVNAVVSRYNAVVTSLREATTGAADLRISIEPLPFEVLVDRGEAVGVADVDVLGNGGICPCFELRDLMAMIAAGGLSSDELNALRVYAGEMQSVMYKCQHGSVDSVLNDDCDLEDTDVFFDASGELDNSGSRSVASSDDSSRDDMESSCTSHTVGYSEQREFTGYRKPAVEDDNSAGVSSSDGLESVDVVSSMTTVSNSNFLDKPSRWQPVISEYSGVLKYQAESVRSQARRDASLLFSVSSAPSAMALERASTARVTHYTVRVCDGRLTRSVGLLNVADVQVLYDPVSHCFMTVTHGSGGATVGGNVSEWCYVSSQMLCFNQETLSREAEQVCIRRGIMTLPGKIDFVQGVPGAGKTTEIIAELKDAKQHVRSMLYLSATRSSAEKVRAAVWGAERRGRSTVMTCDSYLMNSNEEFDVLHLDEAPMVHAGQIYSIVLKTGARKVILWGDFQQIPYCSFTDVFRTPNASIERDCVLVRRSRTHRVRLDVCAAWIDKYDGEFFPCDCCEHIQQSEESWSMRRISSVSEVPMRDNTRYMVFTQQEKVALHQALGFGASVDVLRLKEDGGLATVHEDQGATYDHVIVVRSVSRWDKKKDPLAPSIYNRVAYALTASTRHKYTFEYFTTSDEDDELCKRYVASKCRFRRMAARGEASWKDMVGQAVSC